MKVSRHNALIRHSVHLLCLSVFITLFVLVNYNYALVKKFWFTIVYFIYISRVAIFIYTLIITMPIRVSIDTLFNETLNNTVFYCLLPITMSNLITII